MAGCAARDDALQRVLALQEEGRVALDLERTRARQRSLHSLTEQLTERWQNLVYHAEERYRMLKHAIEWFRTADSVVSVLEQLHQDYLRFAEQDWCRENVFGAGAAGGGAGALASLSVLEDRVQFAASVLSRHDEQKESFLKVSLHALSSY